MSLLDKLEQRFGRFSIMHLVRYFVFAKIAVFVIGLVAPGIYEYLYLYASAVTGRLQLWRVITFLVVPPYTDFYGLIWLVINLYFYYFVGELLERTWGTFRANVYFLLGWLFNVAASFLVPDAYCSDSILYESLFLAFATLYPEMRVYVFYILPVKVKWLGIVTAVMLVIQMGSSLAMGDWMFCVYVLLALMNYIVFFLPSLVDLIKSGSRREQYETKIRNAGPYESPSGGKVIGDKPFHRCCVCGITEKDDPNMTFRYCSLCNGSYEYCANHLRNHEHVQ